jgi:class 3 adenylate cyclase
VEGDSGRPPLPADPVLREVAIAIEEMGRVAEIVDREWRIAYISTGLCDAVGFDPAEAASAYRLSHIEREERFPETWAVDADSDRRWWRATAPYMRSRLPPDAPQFGAYTEAAARIEPAEPPPVWGTWTRLTSKRLRYLPDQYNMLVTLNDQRGEFAGVLVVSWPRLPGPLTGLLSRGDVGMYERMARMSEPHRCETAIVFADLEASGELSRTLSSHAYFELIRNLTTVFDRAVIENDGIVGRHVGDGASAFFCPPDHRNSPSRTAAAAIRAARQARESVAGLGPETGATPLINVGVHWGSTVMMGQIVTGGRLEVTALGDEVNETARIQDAARAGAILASKDLVERLRPDDAALLGLDPNRVSYSPLARIEGVSEKVQRDAGAIPVTEL